MLTRPGRLARCHGPENLWPEVHNPPVGTLTQTFAAVRAPHAPRLSMFAGRRPRAAPAATRSRRSASGSSKPCGATSPPHCAAGRWRHSKNGDEARLSGAQTLHVHLRASVPLPSPSRPQVEQSKPVLETFDLEGVAKAINEGKKKIIVMAGAGISVSAGIPDFRSPGTGCAQERRQQQWQQPPLDGSARCDGPALAPGPCACRPTGSTTTSRSTTSRSRKLCSTSITSGRTPGRSTCSPRSSTPESELAPRKRGRWTPSPPPFPRTPNPLISFCPLAMQVLPDADALLHPPPSREGGAPAMLHAEHRLARCVRVRAPPLAGGALRTHADPMDEAAR